MSTAMRLLPVRVTPALRAVVDQAGTVNAAARALLLLGAHRAGFDLTGLDRDVAGLLAEDLVPDVHAALRQLYGHLVGSPPAMPEPPTVAVEPAAIMEYATVDTSPDDARVDPPPDDPFAVGIDV